MDCTSHAVLAARLGALRNQVSGSPLRAGLVAGDKPGILAGETAICRMREGDEGARYAELIIETVNALPCLLEAAHSSAGEPRVSQVDDGDPLRQQVEGALTQTLRLLPGFKVAATGTWAKLLYAAIEPWLAGSQQAPATAAGQAPQRSPATAEVTGAEQLRLDAVMEFCAFMLEQDDSDNRPNELALEQWATAWDKAHNGALNAAAQAKEAP